MHVSVNMFGEIRANAVRWSLPIENFMSVVAIFGGHFFPFLFSVVGKPSSFSALTANQFPEVTIRPEVLQAPAPQRSTRRELPGSRRASTSVTGSWSGSWCCTRYRPAPPSLQSGTVGLTMEMSTCLSRRCSMFTPGERQKVGGRAID